mmetsp:Transcript_39167/g.101284  ORF Transcript_39167/g.101284 Transcript_39167/m.101284 type:complete len:287 (+) Transcript_39167:612-1472(+)
MAPSLVAGARERRGGRLQLPDLVQQRELRLGAPLCQDPHGLEHLLLGLAQSVHAVHRRLGRDRLDIELFRAIGLAVAADHAPFAVLLAHLRGAEGALQAPPPLLLLLDLLPDLDHVVLDEDQERVRVVRLHLLQLVHELLVVHGAGFVLVQDVEDDVHVLLADVHELQGGLELRVRAEALHDLVEVQAPAVVLVDRLAELQQRLPVPLQLLLLLQHELLHRLLLRLLRLLHDHGQDEVHDAQADGHERRGEEDARDRLVLDDGHRERAPRVPGEDLLHEREHGLLH